MSDDDRIKPTSSSHRCECCDEKKDECAEIRTHYVRSPIYLCRRCLRLGAIVARE